MKTLYFSYKEEDGRNGKDVPFHKDYKGNIWTDQQYKRAHKAQQMRRTIINKKYSL